MPLLVSPIDGSPMRQIHRYGIELDVCPTSGGVWLDRGELEKILAILQEDLQAAAPIPRAPTPAQGQGQAYGGGHKRYDDDDHDDRYRGRKDDAKYDRDAHKYGGKPYKKDKMSRLFDIFDL